MIYKNYDYFLTIAKLGSLTKASEALYITQPSLSKYLSRLEESLNIQLFDRSHSPLTLTYAGQLYYDYINTVLGLNQRLQASFDEIRGDVRGEITMGITSWRSSIILPALLPLFHQYYPNIKVNVVEGKSYTFESAMLNNQVDFCLMTIPSNFSLATIYESLGMEKIYLAGNLNHPLVQQALQTTPGPNGMHRFEVAQLNNQMFIDLKPGQLLYQLNRQFFAHYNVQFREIWSTENTETAINMVNCTKYFTTLPALCKKMNFMPPNVALFEIGDPPMEWEVAIVYPKNAHITHIMRLFIDAIKGFFRNDETPSLNKVQKDVVL